MIWISVPNQCPNDARCAESVRTLAGGVENWYGSAGLDDSTRLDAISVSR